MEKPEISVILCTHNRCASLRRTLEGFRAVRVSPETKWELLLIDNGSTDATRQVADEFKDRLPLRYIFEEKLGQSTARNRAMREAKGSLFLFTDDDVDVPTDWIANYAVAAQRHPKAMFFGGRIYPRWETEPARWLEQHATTMLSTISMYYDRGDAEAIVNDNRRPFWGANMACRVEVFNAGLTFTEEFGIKGNQRVAGEDALFIEEMIRRGWHGVYLPNAAVHHRNAPQRMTESYLRQWFKNYGRMEVRAGLIPIKRLFLGAPLYFWKELVINSTGYLLTRWLARSGTWVRMEIRAAFAWGVIIEARRLNKSQPQ